MTAQHAQAAGAPRAASAMRWSDPPAWLVAAILLLVGGALAAWTWGKSFHLYVDFGRELYVPWRLLEGEVLYRDIAWFNGPLSAYANALAFARLGTSIRTLAVVDLLVVAAVTFLVFDLVRRVASRGTGLACGLVWLVASAFQNLDPSGNFNWAAPYSHELTHGVALALLSLWFLHRALVVGPAARWFAAAGLALGSVLLTKAEVGVAAVAAIGLGLAFARCWRARTLGALLGGTAIPVVMACVLLATAMPLDEAIRGTFASFVHATNPALRALPYYEWCTGLGSPALAVQGAAVWGLALGGTLLPGFLLARGLGTGRGGSIARMALLVLLVALVLLHGPLSPGIPFTLLDPWITAGVFGGLLALHRLAPSAPRALPIAGAALVMLSMPWRTLVYEQLFRPLGAVVLGVWLATLLRRPRPAPTGSGAASADVVPPSPRTSAHTGERGWTVACVTFALVLLAKICLHVRISHYGFGLAMPALVVGVVALLRVPHAVAARGGERAVASATVFGFLAVLGLGLLARYDRQLATRTATFGSGPDRFSVPAGPVTALWARVAEWIATRTSPSATVAVLPEGVMLDYLTRRANGSGHVNFMPPEILMFGEPRILADLQRRPPDYIALMHRPSTEYGLPLFGKDYGRAIMAWVQEQYAVVETIGNPPLQQVDHYGASILARR